MQFCAASRKSFCRRPAGWLRPLVSLRASTLAAALGLVVSAAGGGCATAASKPERPDSEAVLHIADRSEATPADRNGAPAEFPNTPAPPSSEAATSAGSADATQRSSAQPRRRREKARAARDEVPMPYGNPRACEVNARNWVERDRTLAWKQLRRCVSETQFTQLEALLDPPWQAALRDQPDAPDLLARVIARRGGRVESDAKLLRGARAPVTEIESVLQRPEFSRGVCVIVRARVDDVVRSGTGAVIRFAQTTLVSDERRRYPSGGSDTYYSSTTYGDGHTYSYSRSYGPNTGRSIGGTWSEDTGIYAVARAENVDPYLPVDEEVIVVGTFVDVSNVQDPDDPMYTDGGTAVVLTNIRWYKTTLDSVY